MIEIKYKKLRWKWRRKYKYELTEDYEIYLPRTLYSNIGFTKGLATVYGANNFVNLEWQSALNIYRLVIKKGYRWDGTSGPTIDTKNSMRGGLVHDSLYQLSREAKVKYSMVGCTDKLFHWILREDGMSRFRAWYYYKGVNNWVAHGFAKP